MKDMCEFNEKEIEQEEELTLEDMDKEQLISTIEQLMYMREKEIEVNTDNIQNLELDNKEFAKGLKSVSFICGMIAGLSSVGLTKDQVMDYVVNEQNIKFNKDLNSQTCASNERTAKIQQATQEQNQI